MIEVKYITDLEFNKFSNEVFDAKIKQKSLISKVALDTEVAKTEKNNLTQLFCEVRVRNTLLSVM